MRSGSGEQFAADPRLGIVRSGSLDPETGAHAAPARAAAARRPTPSGPRTVTTFLGGASAVRRAVFDQVGRLPGQFFYAHEETDLAWRALDAGWRIGYDAGTVMCHPTTAADAARRLLPD